MANITFSVTDRGTMDAEDRRAAILTIQRRNSLLTDAIPPVAPLPVDTAANIRASYLTVLIEHTAAYHAGNVATAKSPDAAIAAGLTAAQQAEILGAVVDRILNKESYATILADVQS